MERLRIKRIVVSRGDTVEMRAGGNYSRMESDKTYYQRGS